MIHDCRIIAPYENENEDGNGNGNEMGLGERECSQGRCVGNS